MSPEQLEDVLGCGNAQENWQMIVRHWRDRAGMNRESARQLKADAVDATERAAEHEEDARNFDALANALESANVTFPVTAQGMAREAPRPEGSGSSELPSPVGKADAPKG